ncbi:MAG: anthranilate synthase component I family protein [Spirochaetales bacterium]|nr:anthranilate synthase component I family protein [Spirochaetales bacterium]
MINWKQKNIKNYSLEELFSLCHRYKGISLFSSGLDQDEKNRELSGINPVIVLTEGELKYGDNIRAIDSPLDELDKLVELISHLSEDLGLLGYLSYDFKDRLEEPGLFDPKRQGIYEDFYFVLFEKYILSHRGADSCKEYTLSFDFPYSSLGNTVILPSENSESSSDLEERSARIKGTSHNRKGFSRNVRKTISHIEAGDIYQANITRKVEGTTSYDAVELALKLASSNRIEYGVFAHIPGGHVISTSPELFFKTQGKEILTSPIKGTTPRGNNPREDEKQRNGLLHSEKNLAELAMITDLMRNDLSRICNYGSVQVSPFPQLMELENVYHLYSDIRGRLSHNITTGDILKAIFPGGSITGCPKIRSCQIIERLEGEPRGIYTGSFGIIKPKGNSLFNIMIRTLFLQGNHFFYNVGGGITLLSDEEEEFEETRHKGENICRALDTEERDDSL